MFELFSTPRYCQWNIHVHYAQYTGEWNVEGKSYDRSNVKAHNTYGTGRVNGYNKGSSGPQDGESDHVGIVQKVENGVVYTIEGNSGDSCRVNQYPVGYYEILGYGVVAY